MKIEVSARGVVDFIQTFYPKFLKLIKIVLENRDRIDSIENYLMRNKIGEEQYMPTMSFLERNQESVKSFNEKK